MDAPSHFRNKKEHHRLPSNMTYTNYLTCISRKEGPRMLNLPTHTHTLTHDPFLQGLPLPERKLRPFRAVHSNEDRRPATCRLIPEQKERWIHPGVEPEKGDEDVSESSCSKSSGGESEIWALKRAT